MFRLFLILCILPLAPCFSEQAKGEKPLAPSVRPLSLARGLSASDHYNDLVHAYEGKEWKRLEKEALVILRNFSDSLYARDAAYFLGIAYFKQKDYEMANLYFTQYLTGENTPRYFDEVIHLKFEIAEEFRSGSRKHLMGLKAMPKWAAASVDALEIYDEVIAAIPHRDLAAHALFGKASVQANRGDFRASVETYQTLIRRFPKHPFAIESYIGIGEVYLRQSQQEYPDPDHFDLAELNLKKFRMSFPSEERLAVAHRNFIQMQEHYATSFFNTARFYERTKKWGAAKIYYKKILITYPNLKIAEKSRERLEIVEKKLENLAKKTS